MTNSFKGFIKGVFIFCKVAIWIVFYIISLILFIPSLGQTVELATRLGQRFIYNKEEINGSVNYTFK
jgi:hypothetical protein